MCRDETGAASLEMQKEGDAHVMADRLIPSRAARPAGHLRLRDENWAPQNGYQEVLSQNVLGKEAMDVKVLCYKHKPQRRESVQNELRVLYSCNRDSAVGPKPTRMVPQQALRVLDAPGIVDDFYCHPIDWSSRNIVAVALAREVYLFDAASGANGRLLTLPQGEVTALRWTEKGSHLSVGTSVGEVQIWDAHAGRQMRSLKGHGGRLGALAWHQHMLSSGSADKAVHNHDVRERHHLVAQLAGHDDLVCGLDYSSEGVLASGGNDNAVCIWESRNTSGPVHTLTSHRAAVKALRWCPWQRHVLATGGGSADRQVCLWSASSGRLLSSADAASQVTSLLWAQQERELLTGHGFARNQLSLWKYPSLVKVADLEGHSGRLLGMAQSPDGSLVCSAAADETLRFWRVFDPVSSTRKHDDRTVPKSILRTIR